MKRALQISSVASMIDQFNMSNIEILKELGYEVDVAANFEFGNSTSKKRVDEFKRELESENIGIYNLFFNRSIFSLSNIKVYSQLKKIFKENEYNIIHCHSPIGGVITRLAAISTKRKGTKIIYTAHGFHFYKGASKVNWLLYYPIEKICSYFTDIIITINNEDYKLAKKRMKSKKVEYIPGVGLDIYNYKVNEQTCENKRKELGIPKDALLLLSVGELNKNKNHEVIIRALANINNKNIHYCIAGKGKLINYLQELSNKLGVDKNVHLLGFRDDISELNTIADVFCFPSFREGLGLAAIEAMASGNALITSNIHGINDYSLNGYSGYSCNPNSVREFEEAIIKMLENDKHREMMKKFNYEQVKKFDIKQVNLKMKKIYGEQ